MMLCWNATKKFVARMQLHGLGEEYSTGLPEADKGPLRWGFVLWRPIVPPIVLSKKGVMGGVLRMVK